MAFLAVGMAEVLGIVSEAQEKRRRRDEEDAHRAAKEKLEQEEFEREEQEREIRERAFDQEFPNEARRAEVIREICLRHKYPATKGVVGRAFAVAAWWRETKSESGREMPGEACVS